VVKFDRAVVLGSTGMLGSEVLRRFSDAGVPLVALSRSSGFFAENSMAVRSSLAKLNLTDRDLIVNCVGWIPQKSIDNSLADAEQAILVNAIFPLELERICADSESSILQILTDCVFRGDKGSYSEESPQDADDLYGLSKRLGELELTRTMGVRCSIVGRTLTGKASLLDWFLTQSAGSKVSGFTNHLWNGVTTRAFANLALGVFRTGAIESGKFHWLPSDSVSKYDLLEMARALSGRLDLTVNKGDASQSKDSRLATSLPQKSKELWNLAGYPHIPTISELLEELILETLS
jgi:dTDP-4-dehydrorhamnose reductase